MINQEQPHSLPIPKPVELLPVPMQLVEAPTSDRSHHRGAKLTAIALSLAIFGSVAANLR